MRTHVVTLATHEEGYLHFFRKSCERYGISPIILGNDVEWKGFGTKFDILQTYVHDLDDEDVILLVDCYDLIFLRPLDKLFDMFNNRAKAFQKVGKYIYTANEPATSLLKSLLTFHYGAYNDQIINSGSYLLHAGLLKKILTDSRIMKTVQDASADDQKMLTQYLNEHSDVVCEFDNNRRFLLYTNLRFDIGARIKIDDGKLFFRHDRATFRPFLLHRSANGPMCTILKELKYNTDNIDVESKHLGRIFSAHVPNVIHTIKEKIGLIKQD